MSQSDPQGSDLVGTVLGDAYRLTRLIGRGGMGSVYEGVQLRLNKRVAVKLMARELAANAEALARFRREAEVTSQLGHPHIVQVFDFGAAPSGEPYLVMEFLEGEDLEQRMRRVGRMTPAAAAHIIRQIASALSATHAKGIIHRDLKPANVFVLAVEGETDFVKVVDFGISKVRAAATRLTAAAAVMGTPNYMSPEQAAGQVDEIDHRTDQWAVACIAYELIAGRPPFVGDNVASLLYQVVHQAPSPLANSAPGVSSDVEQVLGCALSKKQTERFANMTAFARAFEAAAIGAPAQAPSPAAAAAGAPRSGADVRPLQPTELPAVPSAAGAAPASGPAAAFAAAFAPGSAAAPPPVAPLAPPPPSPPDRAKATTFSAATGESTPGAEMPPARSKPRWAIAGAVGAALVLAAVLVGMRHRGEPASGSSSASAPPAAPAPSPTVGAPSPLPPPAPAAAAAAPAPAAAPAVEAAAPAAATGGPAWPPPAPVKAAKSRRKSGPAWPPPSSSSRAEASAAPAAEPTAPPPAPEPPPPPPPAADAPAWPPPPGAAPATPPPGKPKRGFIRNLRRKIFE